MSKLCNGMDGLCTNAAEADGYCDEHHPLARLTGPMACIFTCRNGHEIPACVNCGSIATHECLACRDAEIAALRANLERAEERVLEAREHALCRKCGDVSSAAIVDEFKRRAEDAERLLDEAKILALSHGAEVSNLLAQLATATAERDQARAACGALLDEVAAMRALVDYASSIPHIILPPSIRNTLADLVAALADARSGGE